MRQSIVVMMFALTACGRTSPWVPEVRAFIPPPCSGVSHTATIVLRVNPNDRPSRSIDHVRWAVSRACSVNVPADPASGSGGRDLKVCSLEQALSGKLVTAGDCRENPGAPFSVGNPSATRDRFEWQLVGSVQGNVCVGGDVFYTDGTMQTMNTRLWRLDWDGGNVNIIDWLLSGDGPPAPATASAPGCPNM